MGWSLPKGEAYLPTSSLEELKKLYRNEKNSKAKIRLLAAISRKEGESLRGIAEIIEYPFTTIRDWLVRMHTQGLERRYNRKQPGKPALITSSQKKQLKKILQKSPEKQKIPFVIWTSQLVQYIIQKLFDVVYSIRNIEKLVNQLGFVYTKPRPKHRKSNKKAQEKFKVELKKKFNITLNLDLRSFALMKPTSL
jgi:transposase